MYRYCTPHTEILQGGRGREHGVPRPTYTADMGGALLVGLCGAVLGLLAGSFLNVCIARLPQGSSIVAPRSHCDTCGHPVRWYDNVPVLSFLLLKGRCRDCGHAIGWRVPAVELLTGGWFALGFLPLTAAPALWSDACFRLLLNQIAFCAVGALLIALAIIDWQWQRLPDVLTIPGVMFGFLLTCTDAMFLGENEYNLVLHRTVNINAAGAGRSTGNIFMTGPEHLVYGRLLSIVVCFLLLYGTRAAYRAMRKRDGMGLGDAKLLALIAAFLGFAPALLALFAGTLLATLFAVALLVRGRATAATRLPFGSFLAAGGMLAALAGAPLVNWYVGLFR